MKKRLAAKIGKIMNTLFSAAKAGTGSTAQTGAALAVGSIITFGQYDWRILDVWNGKALLVTKDVIHNEMKYHKVPVDVTWEKCTLRKWLNKEIYRSFSKQERQRIARRHCRFRRPCIRFRLPCPQ